MKVAVTGGRGFLGRYVVEELQLRDHEPFVLDHEDGWDVRIDPIPPVDTVIHLAGVLGTAELFDHPLKAVSVNITGTIAVLQQCESMGASYVGITMPSVWANVYQATKRCAYDFAMAWHHHRDLAVSHVRAFNVYGPGQKLGPVQKLIPTFAHRAWRDQPLPIWGDGTQQVDLVYAGDVAKVLCDALDYHSGEIFDAGTGEGMSVLGVADIIQVLCGSTAEYDFQPMRPGESAAKVTAEGDGWDLLGWHPSFDAEAFRATVESYR